MAVYYTSKSNNIYPVIKAGKNISEKWIILPRSPLSILETLQKVSEYERINQVSLFIILESVFSNVKIVELVVPYQNKIYVTIEDNPAYQRHCCSITVRQSYISTCIIAFIKQIGEKQ